MLQIILLIKIQLNLIVIEVISLLMSLSLMIPTQAFLKLKNMRFLLLVLVPFLSFSQGELQFKIGAEYRITPIETYDDNFYETESIVLFDQHNQMTGTAFNYTLKYLNKNGYGFGFSQSVQYSHIYYERPKFQDDEEIKKSVNGLLSDFKIFIEKQFELDYDKYLFIEYGFSLMNSGSSFYETTQTSYNLDGTPRFISGANNFNYFATNINIGYIYKNIDFSIGTYISKGSEFYDTKAENTIYLPFFKVNYLVKYF